MRAPYLDDGDVRLYLGDCIEVMAEMEADSVDAVVCDPPYGLEFMGQAWDAPWKGSAAAHAKVRTIRADEVTPTGQAHSTSSGPYLAAGVNTYEAGQPFGAWCETWAREALRVLKPGAHLLAFGGSRTFHRLTCGIEDAGFEIRDCLSWLHGSGFPKSLDVSKAIDKAAGAERVRVATGRTICPGIDRGGECECADRGDNQRSLEHPTKHTTAPATDAAREWQGWGTALKPAWEPCIVARKPLAGTVAENVQQHGTGALNIDGCRIKTDDTLGRTNNEHGHPAPSSYTFAPSERTTFDRSDLAGGRWPANVALDEAAAAMLDAQSGERGGGFGDTGGASRYFYTSKASRADRNTSGANNTHPTVKPTDLMRWLVRLVTPPGGVVLDPFAGSGSTLVAARAEGFRAIGIERETEYADIIAQRLAQLSLLTEENT